MKRIKHIALFCLISLACSSQSVLNIGLGRIFEPSQYQPSLNIDVNYMVCTSFHHLAVKTGSELEPASSFGLKYNCYFMGGYSSDIEKNFSFHLFAGVADNTSARRLSLGSNFQLNEGVSYIFNAGVYSHIGRCQNLIVGLEAYVWKQWLDYTRRESYKNNAVALTITIGYRFDFPKHKLNPQEKVNLKPYNLSVPH